MRLFFEYEKFLEELSYTIPTLKLVMVRP